MAKKKDDPTNLLAIWFVNEFLHRGFDYRAHGRHLRQAKTLVNPGRDKVTGEELKAYALEEVKEALIALRDGTSAATDYLPFHEWWATTRSYGPSDKSHIRSLAVLFIEMDDGQPMIEAVLAVPDPPPQYDTQKFAEWVRAYGAKGIRQEKWDGIFEWLASESPAECHRMTYDELVGIIGEELAAASLDRWWNLTKMAKEKARPQKEEEPT